MLGGTFLGWSYQECGVEWGLFILNSIPSSVNSRPCAVKGRGLHSQRVYNGYVPQTDETSGLMSLHSSKH